jgi:hypothetical protein
MLMRRNAFLALTVTGSPRACRQALVTTTSYVTSPQCKLNFSPDFPCTNQLGRNERNVIYLMHSEPYQEGASLIYDERLPKLIFYYIQSFVINLPCSSNVASLT